MSDRPAPYFECERFAVYCGDCVEIMPYLSGGVSAVVTDPPYGLSYHKGPSGAKVSGRNSCRRNTKPTQGDDRKFDRSIISPWPHLAFGVNHWDAVPPGGTILAWDKAAGGGPADSFADCEFAWVSIPKIKRNIFRYLWKGVCQAGEKGVKRFHPNQKPIALMEWCIGHMGLPAGSLVLDPYMGSGTTGVAAINLGMRFIGIELDEEYCQVAVQRINKALEMAA